MSLKQAKELICEIIHSKRKYDEQCQTKQLPRETMEQYMLTFLNQKYGLKQLILENATGVLQAVKTYSNDDHEVLLFGKILKNTVDEDFWIA